MGASQPITSVSVASNTFVGPLTFTTPGNTVGITSPSALTFAFTATGQPGPTGLQGPAGAAGSNGMGTSGVPGLHFGTTNAAGSSNTAVATDATIALFGTTPTTQAFGDSAVIGTDPLAANALHKHAMPANPIGVLTTEGDLLYQHTGAGTRLAIGSNGSIFTSNGTDPVWGSGPMSAKGDLIAGATSGAVMRVPVGADTTVLTADSTQALGLKWAAPAAGGITHTYPGYNVIGASLETMTKGRWICKKITTTGAGMLLSVGAYLKWQVDNFGGLNVALFADATNAPGRVLAVNLSPADLADLSEATATRNARWFHMPLAYYLAATTSYWLGVMCEMAGVNTMQQITYDAGSDVYFTPGTAGSIADGPYFANTTSVNSYSIRGDFIS